MQSLLAPYWPVLMGVLGALLGSFANVVIHRLPRRENLAWPASHCPECSYRIPPHHNIPIVSYLLLRGYCANCQTQINPRYPIVEGITAAAFAAVALLFPLHASLTSLPFILIIPALVVTVAMWLEGHPPQVFITLPMLAFATLVLVMEGSQMLPEPVPAAVYGGIVGGLLAIISGVRPPIGVIGLGGTFGVLLGLWSLLVVAAAAWQFRLRKVFVRQD